MRESVVRPRLAWWVAVLGGMSLLGVLAFDSSAYSVWSTQVTAALSQTLLCRIFVAAVLTHLAEAVYALRLARRVGSAATNEWFLQTLLLGYPSLSVLVQRARQQR